MGSAKISEIEKLAEGVEMLSLFTLRHLDCNLASCARKAVRNYESYRYMFRGTYRQSHL